MTVDRNKGRRGGGGGGKGRNSNVSNKKKDNKTDTNNKDDDEDAILELHAQSNGASAEKYRTRNNRFILIAAISGFVLYANTIWQCTTFCYDDARAIGMNPDVVVVRREGLFAKLPDVFAHDFWGTPLTRETSNKSYRPLVVLSFRLDGWISANPWMFHVTNAVLFGITCGLVMQHLLLSITPPQQQQQHDSSQNHQWVLLLAGLWFAAHPIHTEAVAGIVGRAEILAALFGLCGMHLSHHDDHASTGRNSLLMKKLVLAPVCFFAACLCKETAVVLPVVLVTVHVASRLLAPSSQKQLQTTTTSSFFADLMQQVALLSVSALYLWLRLILFAGNSALSDLSVQDNFLHHLGPMDKLRTALYIQSKYLLLLLWPDRLSCDYSLGVLEPVVSWFSMEMVTVLVFFGAVVVWLQHALQSIVQTGDSTLLLALGWTLGPLLPASHVVGIGTVLAERLLFLPSIGGAMLLGHVLLKFPKWHSAPYVHMMAGVLLVLAHKTVMRNPDWGSTQRLLDTDLETYPHSLKMLQMSVRFRHAPVNKRIDYAQRAQDVLARNAIALRRPPYDVALRLLADLHGQTNELPNANAARAVEYADQVIAMGTDEVYGDMGWADIYDKRGMALLQLGAAGNATAAEQAVVAFRTALEHVPARGDVHCKLATARTVQQDYEGAREEFHACFADPGNRKHEEQYLDRRTYAISMYSLAGYSTGDVPAARKWGVEAMEAIDNLLEWPEEPGSNKKMVTEEEAIHWNRIKNIVSDLHSTDENTEQANLYRKKGAELLELGASGDEEAAREAADAFRKAIEYLPSGFLHCKVATALTLANDLVGAYEEFQICFEDYGEADDGEQFNDRRSYAVAMHKLAGYSNKDVEAARHWGSKAIEAIDGLLESPLVPSDELSAWNTVKTVISELMEKREPDVVTDGENQ